MFSVDEATPDLLLKRYRLLSIAGAAVIMLLMSTGFYVIFRAEVIFDAEGQSIAVAEAVFAQEQRGFIDPGSGAVRRLGIPPEHLADVDQRIRKYMSVFGLVKVKLYDLDRRIVYSSDSSLVGRVDAHNAQLGKVLESGERFAQLVAKEEASDLPGEQPLVVDVVETYVPVRVDGQIVGAFEVYADLSPAYIRLGRTLRVWIVGLFAVLVVVFGALYARMRFGTKQLAKLQDQLQTLASIDTVTGLYNRRHLFVLIENEKSRMSRAHGDRDAKLDLSLIMVDLDHFKEVNDTRGHQAGDEVLRQVAERLKRTLRPYDVAGRYGGEEFLVVLPDTNLQDARIIAERIRVHLEEAPFMARGEPIAVTASFGVAHTSDVSESVESAINRADQGLYLAKSAGRNRVAIVE